MIINPYRYAATDFPLLTNLVASYDLSEASGPRVDQSGNGYTLTDNNTVGSGTGVGGSGVAADFVSANSESLSQANVALRITSGTDYEVNFWINPDDIANNESLRIGQQRLLIQASGVFICAFTGTGGLTFPQSASGVMAAGVWANVGFVYDSSAEECYFIINGTAQTPTAVNGTPATPTQDFSLGFSNNGWFDGLFQGCRIYSRILTNTERTYLAGGYRSHADIASYTG